ncbi:MAG: type II secretion system F family protein [Mycolicibacterium sp.]|jgi:tight adherence protein B|nr:type II secretion system F family protein [Mycolicibacterium sp.]
MTGGQLLAPVLLATAVLVLPGPSSLRGHARRGFRRLPRATWLIAAVTAATAGPAAGATPATAGCALLLTAGLAVRRRARTRRRRVAEHRAALAGVLESMVAGLRIGAHPVQALESAAAEHDSTSAATLGAVAARARLGGDVPAALTAVADGSPIAEEWLRLASVWRMAAEHGVAIAALLSSAQHDIDERHRHGAAVDAELAGARASTAILAGLPALGILLGHGLGARPLAFLTGSGLGGWCLIAGGVFLTAGVLWAGAITDRVAP